MKRRSRDQEREQRVTMEIVVDAYTPEEQAMGWYYSLEDRLHFPFVARCIEVEGPTACPLATPFLASSVRAPRESTYRNCVTGGVLFAD